MSSPDVVRGRAGTVVEPETFEPNIVAPPPPEWLPAAPSAAPAPEPTPEPAPQRRVRRSPLRHWTVRLVSAPLLVAAVVWPLLLAGGVDSPQAIRITQVVVVQTFGGALLWRLVRGSVGPHLVELTGMGLGVGTLLSLLAQQLLRVTPFAAQAWWLPTAAAALLGVVLLLIPRTRRRLRLGMDAPLGLDEAGGVGLGLGVGFLFVWLFWQAHPLSWTGWWAYYSDIPYHEALATSVTTWGPGDNILAVGSPVRYHWFADAWAGTTTNASAAEPFVVMTRLLPLVALLGTVCLVWAWARRLSDSRAVPVLAVVLTTVALNIGSTLPVDFMHLLTLSPSLGIGALWLLGAALVFTEFVSGRLGWTALLPLALLAVGCVGGKTSNAAALLGGIGLAALACVLRPGVRARVWAAFGVVLVVTGGAFVVLILGSAGNLTVQAGATATVFHVLPPDGSWIGVAGGTLGAVLVLATKWTGITVLTARRATLGRPEVWFGIGAALTGLILMGGLGHPGASQIYFPVSAGLLVAVLSAWGLGEALRRMTPATVSVSVVVGVIAGAVSLVLGPAVVAAAKAAAAEEAAVTAARSVAGAGTAITSAVASAAAKAAAAGSFGGLTRAPLGRPLVVLSDSLTWIAPYAVWALPVLLVLGAALRARVRRARYPRGGLAGILCWSVVTASVVAGAVGFVDMAQAPGRTISAPNSGLAWSDMQREPMLWLRDHSATDDIVATNRQCSSTEAPGHRCMSTQRWFLTAALTGRRMYVEGADYAVAQPHPTWVDHRVQTSRRFVDAPTAKDARVLWDAGVRWVVVDLSSTRTRDWTGFAEPVHRSPTTVILKLDRP